MAATRASSGGAIPLRRVLKETPHPPPPLSQWTHSRGGQENRRGGDCQAQNVVAAAFGRGLIETCGALGGGGGG